MHVSKQRSTQTPMTSSDIVRHVLIIHTILAILIYYFLTFRSLVRSSLSNPNLFLKPLGAKHVVFSLKIKHGGHVIFRLRLHVL